MLNKPRFLITTSYRRSWRYDTPILFLGEWCNFYDKDGVWENCDTEVVSPYGLDKDQKENDLTYIHELYETLLVELTDELNSFHGVNHTTRYWRILLGTWLFRFTTIVYNRWATIHRAISYYAISDSIVVDFPRELLIPLDYLDFIRLNRAGVWEHQIYGRILNEWTDVPCSVIPFEEAEAVNVEKFTKMHASVLKLRLKKVFITFVNVFTRIFSRSTDALIISSYLPFWQEFKLQFALGQIFCLRRSPNTPEISHELKVRAKLSLNADTASGFEKFIREIIPEQIPKCYLEGFSLVQEVAEGLLWPEKPKFIFTSNNFDSDEVFKAWTATHVEKGVPYYIGQHGGNYGTAAYAMSEIHEVATASHYLTWGWEEVNCKKYLPVSALSLIGKPSIKNNSKGGLLLVERGFCSRPYAWDETPLYKNYLEDQFTFVEELPNSMKSEVTIRLYAAYFYLSWSEDQMWKDRFPEICLDYGQKPIDCLIKENRLTVHTYNSTGILETLFLNVPTLIFWNTNHWPLRESAQPYFDRLKDAGIFHENPKSAAIKVNEIWEDVDGWWNGKDVQEARRFFCDRFAHMSENPIRELKQTMLANVG